MAVTIDGPYLMRQYLGLPSISDIQQSAVPPPLGLDKLNIIQGAATVLTASQSGSLCIWNAAAGYLFTLPTPQVGLYYDFFVQTTITSVGAKVITNSASVFILGDILQGLVNTTPAANPGPKFFSADGSTIVSINMYGVSSDTTTGGVVGSSFRMSCISATQWLIEGYVIATGTIATPFANS